MCEVCNRCTCGLGCEGGCGMVSGVMVDDCGWWCVEGCCVWGVLRFVVGVVGKM